MVISGSGAWHLDERDTPAQAGGIQYARPWDVHGIKNTGPAPLTLVVWKGNNKGVPLPLKHSASWPTAPGGDEPEHVTVRLAPVFSGEHTTATELYLGVAMLRTLAVFLLASLALPAWSAEDAWVAESNRHAQVLLDLLAEFQPESAASIGVEGRDDQVLDLKPNVVARQDAALVEAIRVLEQARAEATDRLVQIDLDILLGAARDFRTTLALQTKHLVPFVNAPEAIYRGFQDLLDARVAKERHAAALVRLRRYVGAEPGYEPLLKLARDRFEEAATNPALLGPWVVEVEQYLQNQPRFLAGIEQLLKDSGLKGWQRDFRTLSKQFAEYERWVRTTVLPRARKENRLPPELYADNLKSVGVYMKPEELMERALASFAQTRSELQSVAQQVAAERKLPSSDYRDVIRALKKEQIGPDRILGLYTERLKRIEAIVRERNLVTLPQRDAVIRLATEAESAAQPAPHVDPPRLIGNTGEPAEFVLPLANPNAAPGSVMDDFTYDGIAWTLTAHEARPGHELQFAAMLERGVSAARIVFAFNSANVEGWALYAEAVMKDYLPPEGRIGSLQMRMMREARAFLDPMLNLGMIQPEDAQRFLMEEVLLSEPMAKQEVDRYTFRMPGQATAYFYGYTIFNALRTRVELALRERFDERAFHDFIIGQGLLPLTLLERVVMEDFVKPRLQ
jgi:hypothetical protein